MQSPICTTSFSKSYTSCLTCMHNSHLINTPSDKKQLHQDIKTYEKACKKLGKPITIHDSGIFGKPTETTSTKATPKKAHATTETSPKPEKTHHQRDLTSTQSSTTSTPSTGDATQIGFDTGAILAVMAFVAASLF
jgi:hypothetical protein